MILADRKAEYARTAVEYKDEVRDVAVDLMTALDEIYAELVDTYS